MSAPTLIARIVPKISRKMMGKHRSKARLPLSSLLEHWAEIIAPQDPMAVRPDYVGWKWLTEGTTKTSQGTLHITAPSAIAAKLVYQQAIIIGRVNRIFGLPESHCIHRISITHDKRTPTRIKKAKPQGTVSADTKDILANIEDPLLRERLEGLAQAIATDELT